MRNSTTASSSSCNVHRLRPLGGREQAKAINFASAAPSKMRGLAEAGECLRTRTASNPSSTSCWRVRATVSVLVSRAAAIWLSLHPSPASEASAFNRMRALVSSRAGCLPACTSVLSRSRSSSQSFTTYFFTALCFAVTMHLRLCGASDSEIHRRIKDGGVLAAQDREDDPEATRRRCSYALDHDRRLGENEPNVRQRLPYGFRSLERQR